MATGTLILIGTGSAVVFVQAIQDKRDPFPAIMAEGIFTWVCLAADTLSDSHNLGTMFAGAFLLAVLLTHGVTFINTVKATAKPAAGKPHSIPLEDTQNV